MNGGKPEKMDETNMDGVQPNQSQPTDQTQTRSTTSNNNKPIIATLIVLCVAIIGLTAGIVYYNLTKQPSQDTQEAPTQTQTNNTNSGTSTTEQIASMEDFQADYSNLTSTTEELLNQTPANAAEAQSLYSQYAEKYLAQGDTYYAYSILLSGSNTLENHGYKTEALTLLTNSDLTVYSTLDQEYFYKQIISLAEELGQSEVANEYTTRLNNISEEADILRGTIKESAKTITPEAK